jgi:hypothetical protein
MQKTRRRHLTLLTIARSLLTTTKSYGGCELGISRSIAANPSATPGPDPDAALPSFERRDRGDETRNLIDRDGALQVVGYG